jgi:hypothetical protein
MRRPILILLLSLLATSAYASGKDVTFDCKPVTKPNPFAQIQIVSKGKTVTVNATFAGADDTSGDDESNHLTVKSTGDKLNGGVYDPVLSESGRGEEGQVDTLQLTFDYGDFLTTTVDIKRDDEGLAAFVDFNSDGEDIRSMYRCEAKY